MLNLKVLNEVSKKKDIINKRSNYALYTFKIYMALCSFVPYRINIYKLFCTSLTIQSVSVGGR